MLISPNIFFGENFLVMLTGLIAKNYCLIVDNFLVVLFLTSSNSFYPSSLSLCPSLSFSFSLSLSVSLFLLLFSGCGHENKLRANSTSDLQQLVNAINDKLNARFDVVQLQISGMGQSLREVKQNMNELGGKVASIESKQCELSNSVGDLVNRLDMLEHHRPA